jgi:hypothetical protein
MPNRSSLYSNLSATSLLVPAVRNSDTNSSGMDLRDSESAALLFHVGASADTLSGTNKIELEVQESDDNSTFTAVANLDMNVYTSATNVGTGVVVISNATASQSYIFGYKGNKRYIRGVLNFSGTHSTGTPIGIIGLRGGNHYLPQNANT